MSDKPLVGREPMNEARRRAYLEAMGIPVWLPRAPAEPEAPAATVTESFAAEQLPSMGADAHAVPEPAPGADVAAMDWNELREAILGCRQCGLCESRTQAVPGVGNVEADLLVIGEAPGQEEDRQGEPFVGRAGQLLDRMLAAIGLDRRTVFITNVLKCRPPNNRAPAPEEVHACTPYLRRQIELIAPRAILSVGRVSAQNLLETPSTLGRLRGTWHRFGPRETPLRVTYHPAYLLRNPAAKRQAWDDLKRVRDQLHE